MLGAKFGFGHCIRSSAIRRRGCHSTHLSGRPTFCRPLQRVRHRSLRMGPNRRFRGRGDGIVRSCPRPLPRVNSPDCATWNPPLSALGKWGTHRRHLLDRRRRQRADPHARVDVVVLNHRRSHVLLIGRVRERRSVAFAEPRIVNVGWCLRDSSRSCYGYPTHGWVRSLAKSFSGIDRDLAGFGGVPSLAPRSW